MPPKSTCGNPLFLQFAEEIYADAAAANAKCAIAYRKAVKSIQLCPLPYGHPKQLIALSWVGPGLIKRLEKRWREYYQELGKPIPEDGLLEGSQEGGSDDEGEGGSGESGKMTGKRKSRVAAEEAGNELDIEGENASEPNPSAKKKPKRTTKPKTPKMYVPKVNSGPYALFIGFMLALPPSLRKPLLPVSPDDPDAQDEQEDSLRHALENSYLMKGELITSSQPYSDSSFTSSESGGFYTAWSSMKGLITKGLVAQRGNPIKYYLTPEGWRSALAIHTVAFPAENLEERRQAALGFQPSPDKAKRKGKGAVVETTVKGKEENRDEEKRDRRGSPLVMNDVIMNGMNVRPDGTRPPVEGLAFSYVGKILPTNSSCQTGD